MTVRSWLVGAVLLAACGGDPEAPQLLDTGWFTDDDAPGCPHTFVASVPEDGTQDWYYLDAPSVLTSTTEPGGYEITLADAEGRLVAANPSWSEDDGAVTLGLTEPLEPATDYQIVVQDCERATTVDFRTSSFGRPLTDQGSGLAGRTYRLDLAGADWRRPEGLGPTIASFLTEPILLGVVYVDAERIDLLGAPSSVDDFGVVSQASVPTWDFPVAEFDVDDPTFSVSADAIELLVEEGNVPAEIPITDFVLSGTISPDGTRLGGGVISGIADTRSVSEGFSGSASFICDLAETSFQLSCSPCESDGERFCLDLEAAGVSGVEQPGLTLVSRTP